MNWIVHQFKLIEMYYNYNCIGVSHWNRNLPVIWWLRCLHWFSFFIHFLNWHISYIYSLLTSFPCKNSNQISPKRNEMKNSTKLFHYESILFMDYNNNFVELQWKLSISKKKMLYKHLITWKKKYNLLNTYTKFFS